MVQSITGREAPNIYINGVKLPTPSGLEVSIQDVDYDSGRTADGTMHRNRVGIKRKLKITWPPQRPEGVAQILQSVYDPEFTVDYLDPYLGTMATGTFYAGDRSAPMFNYYLNLYDSMSFDLIEY